MTTSQPVNVEVNLLRIDKEEPGFRVEMCAKLIGKLVDDAVAAGGVNPETNDVAFAGVRFCVRELLEMAAQAQGDDDAAELAARATT